MSSVILHIAATDEGASADGQPSVRLGGRRAGPQGRADGPGATPAWRESAHMHIQPMCLSLM